MIWKVWDYIHLVILAKGYIAVLEYSKEHSGCEVFNLGTGQGYSVLDLVAAFERVNGVRVPYEIVDRRPGDIAVCYASTRKASEVLGWKAEKGIDEMCRDSWGWEKRQEK